MCKCPTVFLHLRPLYMGSDLYGSDPILAHLIVAFTRVGPLTNPMPLESSIRSQTGSLSKVIQVGSDPIKIPVNGWNRILQTRTDRK